MELGLNLGLYFMAGSIQAGAEYWPAPAPPYFPALFPMYIESLCALATECTSASTMLWLGGPIPLLEAQDERVLWCLNDKDPQRQRVQGAWSHARTLERGAVAVHAGERVGRGGYSCRLTNGQIINLSDPQFPYL